MCGRILVCQNQMGHLIFYQYACICMDKSTVLIPDTSAAWIKEFRSGSCESFPCRHSLHKCSSFFTSFRQSYLSPNRRCYPVPMLQKPQVSYLWYYLWSTSRDVSGLKPLLKNSFSTNQWLNLSNLSEEYRPVILWSPIFVILCMFPLFVLLFPPDWWRIKDRNNV